MVLFVGVCVILVFCVCTPLYLVTHPRTIHHAHIHIYAVYHLLTYSPFITCISEGPRSLAIWGGHISPPRGVVILSSHQWRGSRSPVLLRIIPLFSHPFSLTLVEGGEKCFTHTLLHTHILAHIHTPPHVDPHIYIHTSVPCTHTRLRIYASVHIHTYTHTYLHHTHPHSHTFALRHIDTHTHTHIPLNTFIFHIYTYPYRTHTCTLTRTPIHVPHSIMHIYTRIPVYILWP
jgi:hypothetical protein